MVTKTIGSLCIKCDKENAIATCVGWLSDFCHIDFGFHRQELTKILDDIEKNCDLLRQSLADQHKGVNQHHLIQQIDQWEQQSINRIKQTAEKTRQVFRDYTFRNLSDLELKLKELMKQLKESRRENDYIETHLNEWNQRLIQLQEDLTKLTNIQLEDDSSPLISKIYADLPPSLWIPNINIKSKLIPNGITVTGGNEQGDGLIQLSYPWGFYVDDNQTIYVADSSNHRIVEWKAGAKTGRIVAGGNGQGNRVDQLNKPSHVIVDKTNDSLIICDFGNQRIVRWSRQNGSTSGETIISNIHCCDLTMDNDGYLYVCDYQKHEVKRWKIGDTDGTLVAGGNARGDRLDQLNSPYHIFVDQTHSVFVSDYNNHRVMKWMKDAKEGIIVAGGQGQGNQLTQLSSPRGVTVDQFGNIYVAEWDNHRVTRWSNGTTRATIVVGGNDAGEKAYQLRGPVHLSFDLQNNLYVTDNGNHRIQKFNIDFN